MFHQWMSCEDECSTCIRCGGHWDDAAIDGTPGPGMCHADEADFRMVHGDPEDAGHSLECEKFAFDSDCKHLASKYDCNCGVCVG